jgi:hypothetical protein
MHVRVFEETQPTDIGALKFEIENTGSRPTSLKPMVSVSYWLLQRGKLRRHKGMYAVREIDRELPPFRAKVFSASGQGLHDNYGFSWFRTFTIRTTTGHWTRVHVRHQMLTPLSAPRFWFELALYRFANRVEDKMARTLREFDDQRRRQGPH